MPETIKVKEGTHARLVQEMRVRETFDDVIVRLLDTQTNVRLLLGKLTPIRPDPPAPGEEAGQ